MFSINYLAVILALIAYTVLGMLWYGPFFGKIWLKLTQMEGVDMDSPEAKKSQIIGIIASIVSGFFALWTLSVVMQLSGIGSALKGLFFGTLIGFGFIAMTFIGEAAWHNKPWALVGLNSSYRILGLAIGGLIIGAW